jgi:hypothetical protein
LDTDDKEIEFFKKSIKWIPKEMMDILNDALERQTNIEKNKDIKKALKITKNIFTIT